jgi:hypothetical protein
VENAHEFRGPTSQTRKKPRVYLEQGKQNKMCAFVNTTTCSNFQSVRAETTENYLEKYKSKGNNSAKNYQTTYLLCNTP